MNQEPAGKSRQMDSLRKVAELAIEMGNTVSKRTCGEFELPLLHEIAIP